MSRGGRLARRAFLVGSAAVVGGVVFGVHVVRRPHPNPLLAELGPGEVAITPYVRIDAQGITLITPRADMGQGAWHVQAALLAEELDVDPGAVRVDPGPPAPAYWNRALALETAEFLAPSEGVLRDLAQSAAAAASKVMGLQITGGSTTVPDGHVRLRAAGASARETLKRAAAERMGVAVADLRTEAAHVILPDGGRLSYVELAPDAARIAPVRDVPLRDPSRWRHLGRPMQRLDMVAKCSGAPIFGIDEVQEGMLFATVLLNPAQGGGLIGFDAGAALAMRGVRAVVPVTGGLGIVADNSWRAFRAAEAIEAQWGPAAFPSRMEDHWGALEAALENAPESRKRDDGDVEAALAQGGIIAATYRAPYLPHAPLEPLNATVLVEDDAATVWTGTQIPRFVQDGVARIAGISPEAVRVHVRMMGGSFGHRLEDGVVRHAAEIAAQMKGTPIKLTYARETDFRRDYPRQIAMARLRGRVAEGRVETLDLAIAMPSVIASQMGRQGQFVPGPDSQIVAGAWNMPLAIPNHRVSGHRAPELAPISSWRSVGASTNGFFHNAAFDELVHAAGADPLAERLRLCADGRARRVLEAVGEMSGWGRAPGAGRGLGVALVTSFGVPCAEVVEVALTPDGFRVEAVWVACAVGRVLDPVNFEGQVQGGVIWGLGHAISGELSYEDGIARQQNFDSFASLRLRQCPEIAVRAIEDDGPVLGVGEPPVPPAAPALAGAIFAATGQRLREMPFDRSVTFA